MIVLSSVYRRLVNTGKNRHQRGPSNNGLIAITACSVGPLRAHDVDISIDMMDEDSSATPSRHER